MRRRHPPGLPRHRPRELLARGLAPDEAANVVAVFAGLRIAAQPWTVVEVNRLLFLRALRETGRWAPNDGAA